MNDELYEKLGAYYDGELPASQQEEMRLLISSNPECQKVLDQFKMASDAMSKLTRFTVPSQVNMSEAIFARADQVNGQKRERVVFWGAKADGLDDSNPDGFDMSAPRVKETVSNEREPESGFGYFTNNDSASWRTRLSRALLWPTLVVALAIGFWSTQQRSNVPVIVIDNSSYTNSEFDDSDVLLHETGLASSESPAADSGVVQPASFGSGKSSVELDSAIDLNNPQLVDVAPRNGGQSSSEDSDADQADLFEAPVPFIDKQNPGPIMANAGVSTDSSVGTTSEEKQAVETDLAQSELSRSGANPPSNQDTAYDGTDPLRAINVSSSNNDTFVNETRLELSEGSVSPLAKPHRLAFQCRFRSKNFDESSWNKLLAEMGIATESQTGSVAANWLWNAPPRQRADFMQKARQIEGMESVESMVIPIDSEPSSTNQKAGWTEIRLIPVE